MTSSTFCKLQLRVQVVLVVDQDQTVGALPVAVASEGGILVGYLPGLTMRRIADLHPGEAKTDARDAAIIAEATRTLPHALRPLSLEDEQMAELPMLWGFDDDIVGQMTATSNRIRRILMRVHPALKRILGAHLDHPADLCEGRWFGTAWHTPVQACADDGCGPAKESFLGSLQTDRRRGRRPRRRHTSTCGLTRT